MTWKRKIKLKVCAVILRWVCDFWWWCVTEAWRNSILIFKAKFRQRIQNILRFFLFSFSLPSPANSVLNPSWQYDESWHEYYARFFLFYGCKISFDFKYFPMMIKLMVTTRFLMKLEWNEEGNSRSFYNEREHIFRFFSLSSEQWWWLRRRKMKELKSAYDGNNRTELIYELSSVHFFFACSKFPRNISGSNVSRRNNFSYLTQKEATKINLIRTKSPFN